MEQRRRELPWAAVTLYDPLLQPVKRRFFGQTEPGDLVSEGLVVVEACCLRCAGCVRRDML